MATATNIDSFTMPVQSLRTMLSRVAFAADNEGTRYALHAVRFECDMRGARTIATDGKRLAYHEEDTFMRSEPIALMIPASAARDLVKRINSSATGSAEISICGDEISVAWRGRNNRQLKANFRQIEGRFPNWREVIEPTTDKVGTLSEQAQNLAALLPDIEQNTWLFKAEGGKRPTLKAPSVEFKIKQYSGGPVDTAFNPQYLSEWLAVIPDNAMVTVDFHERDKYGNDRPIIAQWKSSFYVFMPCNPDR